MQLIFARASCLALWLLVSATGPALAGPANSLMDLSADGRLLVCSNRDSGSITIVDTESLQKRFEVTVGHKPEGVTFVGTSHVLAVTVYADDQIVFVDADRGEIVGRCDVFDEPYGLVSNHNGSRLWATLELGKE